MAHKSVPLLDHPCEFINIVPMNPLISKCQIKVCYVSDKPNRNRSIITKDVAREMANVRDLAQRFEITGTPFLIINGQAFPGAIPANQIKTALDK